MKAGPQYLDKNGFILLTRPLAPGVSRLRVNDPTFSDLAGVLTGVKPVTYTDCLPESLPALKELCEKLKLKYLLPEKIFGRQGGHFGAGRQKEMVLIGKNPEQLAAAAKAWSVSTTEAPWALSLGYPQCCVKAFIKWFRDGDRRKSRDELVRRIFSNTGGGETLDFRLNNVWNYFSRIDFKTPGDCLRHSRILDANKKLDLPSLHIISWHPCSYSCAASGEKAGIIFSFLKRHCPAYAGELENRLARPVLFFGKYEYLVLDGRFSNPVMRYRAAPEPRSLLNPKIRRLIVCCDTLKQERSALDFYRNGKRVFSSGVPGPLFLNFSKNSNYSATKTPRHKESLWIKRFVV
ncbi:MAG: hypothetical protein KKH28_01895 [Elusimicrobia bacterium]|nr:hypothetical protein [Elusimicrobiota bacterium]